MMLRLSSASFAAVNFSSPLKLKLLTSTLKMSTAAIITDNAKPKPDTVISDISSYTHNYKVDSQLAFKTAHYCFLDSLGCALAALKYPQATSIIGPVVPMTVPHGARVIGTSFELDPVQAAFSNTALIRWLDYNDCWLAAEWGHPSDNLGSIISVADYLNRTGQAKFTVNDVLEGLIKCHEIQGCLALENSFNAVGLDHVLLVKVASTAVVSKMLGLTEDQTIDALSQAFVDGQALRTYRHAPNTMSRKSWAAADAVARAVNLAYLVKKGQGGMPSILTAKTWGFYDVLFKGKEFKFQRPYGSYVMENVLFKISFPAEFHAQTAVEAALTVNKTLASKNLTYKDIKSIRIRTQNAGMRIIDKKGPLHNYADRDHCIQYMVAIPLIYGRLTADDYSDSIASNPDIDALREKMYCVEDEKFTTEYHEPEKRYIGNAIQVTLNDGQVLDDVVVDFPIGHKNRREEGIPVLMEKFKRHLNEQFKPDQVEKILKVSEDYDTLKDLNISDYLALYKK